MADNSDDENPEIINSTTKDRIAIKAVLLASHQQLAAHEIVLAFTDMYPNTATASSQLSRFKKQLREQVIPPPPSTEYLKNLRLSTGEYATITTAYAKKRDDQSRDARVLKQPDLIAQVAQILLQSDDFRDLWPACIVVSGLRPADLMTVVIEAPKHTHVQEDFWVSISNVAKKKVGHASDCFEHPLLAPRWLFLRAVGIVRDYFADGVSLTKEEYSMRYSSYWKTLLDTAFGFVGKDLSHVLFRRFYAKYAFVYFKSDFLPAAITEHGFVSFALMHDSNEPALAYGNLSFEVSGSFDLFVVGRGLVAMGNPELVRKRPRSHVDLAFR